MNKFKLTSGTALFLLLALYFVIQLPFLTSVTKVWVDEPWYANIAYNFSQGEGLVDTITRGGKPWSAFLYPLIMGLFFKVFDATAWTGRFVSVLAGSVALVGFIQVQRLWKIKPFAILLTGFLFIISNVYYVVFRTIRPEAWCVAFAIWGFYFLAKGAHRSRTRDFMLSALMISCSVLCHPNGVLYAPLFGLFALGYSWCRKDVRPIVGFGVIGLGGVLIWLFYYAVISGADVMGFLSSATSRTVVERESALCVVWGAMKTFASTYTLGFKRLYIFVFEVGVLVSGLLFLRRDRRLFFTALSGLLYFLIALVFFQPFATRHFGEVLFFLLLVVALLIQRVGFPKWIRWGVCSAVILYGLNNLAGTAYLAFRDCRNTPFGEISAELERQVPAKAEVLSLMPFWFGVKQASLFSDYTRWEQKGYEGVDSYLEGDGPDFVVISSYLLEGKTGASGRKDTTINVDTLADYCQKVISYAEQNGTLSCVIDTRGYGQVSVWKISPVLNKELN